MSVVGRLDLERVQPREEGKEAPPSLLPLLLVHRHQKDQEKNPPPPPLPPPLPHRPPPPPLPHRPPTSEVLIFLRWRKISAHGAPARGRGTR